MKSHVTNAVTEILLNDEPFTNIEAIVLFGRFSLTGHVSRLRREGFVFDTVRVPLETVYRRLDQILGKRMPRPRYVDPKIVLTTQYQRNTSKETRSVKTSPVYKAPKDATGLQVRRAVR